jgi:hypothetical protein
MFLTPERQQSHEQSVSNLAYQSSLVAHTDHLNSWLSNIEGIDESRDGCRPAECASTRLLVSLALLFADEMGVEAMLEVEDKAIRMSRDVEGWMTKSGAHRPGWILRAVYDVRCDLFSLPGNSAVLLPQHTLEHGCSLVA